jgi:hypothetical protein
VKYQSFSRNRCFRPSFLAFLFCVFLAGTLGAQVTGFVTRSGSTLQLNGSTFRYAGANIYWLGLDENVGGVAYPTNFRVTDALSTAKEMGATVVRSTTLGVSTGNSLSVEPSLNTFNDAAFASIDYAVATASKLGIRLIIPLTDNYSYYEGGEHNFTDWQGLTVSAFYDSPTIESDFERYINHLLTHVSTITGIALKDDPAIMAWETGNEIHPPTAWTSLISTYIKSIDTNHLVLDGHYGVDTGALSLSTVDLVGAHFNDTAYAMTASALSSQVTLANGERPFIVGEFDWSDYHGGGNLTGFLSAVQSTTAVGGATYWSLFGHLDTYGYEQHNDGFTLHYPGDTVTMSSEAQQLRSFAYGMSGLSTPTSGIPNSPLITSIDSSGNVEWRGSVGGNTYQLEESTAGPSGPWTTLSSGSVTDNNLPYADSSYPTGGAWFRVKAENLSSAYGPYSGFFWSGSGSEEIADALNDWTYVIGKSSNLGFDTSNSDYFLGDTSRVRRTVDDTESFYYVVNGLSAVTLRVFSKSSTSVLANSMHLAASTDGGITFQDLTYSLGTGFTGGGGGWIGYDISPSGIPAGANTFKITLYTGTGESYDPEVSQVTLNYSH